MHACPASTLLLLSPPPHYTHALLWSTTPKRCDMWACGLSVHPVPYHGVRVSMQRQGREKEEYSIEALLCWPTSPPALPLLVPLHIRTDTPGGAYGHDCAWEILVVGLVRGAGVMASACLLSQNSTSRPSLRTFGHTFHHPHAHRNHPPTNNEFIHIFSCFMCGGGRVSSFLVSTDSFSGILTVNPPHVPRPLTNSHFPPPPP